MGVKHLMALLARVDCQSNLLQPLRADVSNTYSVAITGTPGVGKSTICDLFRQESYSIFTVRELAQQHNCLGEYSEHYQSHDIDIHTLAELWQSDEAVIIDGHLSHFLDIDAIVMLRCEPIELAKRLAKREYSESKIRQNTEWELISGTWAELSEFEISVPILEIDTTSKTQIEVFEMIKQWLASDLAINYETKRVDWLDD